MNEEVYSEALTERDDKLEEAGRLMRRAIDVINVLMKIVTLCDEQHELVPQLQEWLDKNVGYMKGE